MTFASLEEAYARASWASARIISDGTPADVFREAVRVHRLASAYIVRVESLPVSSRPKTVSLSESRVTAEHRQKGHDTQTMTLQEKLNIATTRYLRFVAEHGGTVISTMLYASVTVTDLGGLSDNRHKYRLRAVLESGLLSRHKNGNNYMLTITDKGRRWLREQASL